MSSPRPRYLQAPLSSHAVLGSADWADEPAGRWHALVLIALAQIFGMSLWFSASAVTPTLRTTWHLSGPGMGLLTTAVQLGFIIGSLLSALLNLADILPVRYLFGAASLAGALCNLSFALFADSLGPGLALRLLTGVCLAGVYPPGIKLMSSWFQQGRGLAVGVLIGALAVGSALPRLISAQGLPWRMEVGLASGLAAAGGAIVVLWVKEGPYRGPTPPLNLAYVASLLRNRPLRLVFLGYCGHMWELYAMWTWLPAYLAASFAAWSGTNTMAGNTVAFGAAGVAGFAGCVSGGWLADRLGRTAVTTVAMALSGSCALANALVFGLSPVLVVIVALIWGISVIADSAQFSVAVTELADQRYIGTALTLQTSAGFLVTIITIQLVPVLAAAAGWRIAFLLLVPGPVAGIIAMVRLRGSPEAAAMAHGLR